MTTPQFAPEPFFEIMRAHTAFEVFELDSAQIGSGRPKGPRSELWGSIVVLARASLEEALRRIHRSICPGGGCSYGSVPLDSANFKIFFDKHGVQLADSIPIELHVALRSKPKAKGGEGTGVQVNGPLTKTDLLNHLDALNHIRNGFAHRDPKKTEKLPPHGEGVLWVAPQTGSEWTVQKPHALSAMRFCHSVFRFVVLSCCDADAAKICRSELPLLLEDRLAGQQPEDVHLLHQRLGERLGKGDLKVSLTAVQQLRVALLSLHVLGNSLDQPPLFPETQSMSLTKIFCDPIVELKIAAPGSADTVHPSRSLFDL